MVRSCRQLEGVRVHGTELVIGACSCTVEEQSCRPNRLWQPFWLTEFGQTDFGVWVCGVFVCVCAFMCVVCVLCEWVLVARSQVWGFTCRCWFQGFWFGHTALPPDRPKFRSFFPSPVGNFVLLGPPGLHKTTTFEGPGACPPFGPSTLLAPTFSGFGPLAYTPPWNK